jgi:hypothetical protein
MTLNIEICYANIPMFSLVSDLGELCEMRKLIQLIRSIKLKKFKIYV